MSFGKFISECSRMQIALDAELAPEDVEMLRSHCAIIGKDKWLSWTDEHREEISEFVAGDGAHRRRVKILDAEKHRRLVLAAIQRVTAAERERSGSGGESRDGILGNVPGKTRRMAVWRG